MSEETMEPGQFAFAAYQQARWADDHFGERTHWQETYGMERGAWAATEEAVTRRAQEQQADLQARYDSLLRSYEGACETRDHYARELERLREENERLRSALTKALGSITVASTYNSELIDRISGILWNAVAVEENAPTEENTPETTETDDADWIARAEEAEKSGFVGHEESMAFLFRRMISDLQIQVGRLEGQMEGVLAWKRGWGCEK